MADGEMQIENIDETDKERRKFNLIPGEDLMQIHRPSLFAFAGMYVMAFLVGAVHYIWTFMPSEAPGEPGVIQDILWSFVSSSLGESIGFPLVMLFLAWFNRWMNISSSTKWFTVTMIFIAALPFTAWMINAFAADSPVNFLDGSYPYQIAGIFWIAFLFVNIYYFQRSFCYAITTDAVIFRKDFMLTNSVRRILYSNFTDVIVQQGPIGTIMGYGNVVPLTGSGLGLGEETIGISAGAAGGALDSKEGESVATSLPKKIIKMFFVLLTSQRTIRTVKPDPADCFYGVRKPHDVTVVVNDRWKGADSGSTLEEIKDLMAAQAANKSE
ncbi:MAG: Uncharacterised protein [Methanobacteriota archaeon]|nr:MAG: Uncharacterised protein [Euryarchaeota archaeon]